MSLSALLHDNRTGDGVTVGGGQRSCIPTLIPNIIPSDLIGGLVQRLVLEESKTCYLAQRRNFCDSLGVDRVNERATRSEHSSSGKYDILPFLSLASTTEERDSMKKKDVPLHSFTSRPL